MLFNSTEFAVYFALIAVVYWGLLARAGWRTRKAFLTIASYGFYMSWNPAFGLLLFASTVLDYSLGLLIEATAVPSRRRWMCGLSCAFNLGMLGFFKYGGFVAENVWPWVGGTGDPPLADILLPVGISFYTFESLSYTIDVYRGERACRDFLDFSLFLSFFPHLVAGPIVRPRFFLPQLAQEPVVTPTQRELALARIAQGFVKKMVLADVLALYVDKVWWGPQAYPLGNVLLVMYAYAFQIYFDFSGYTDIALGLAQLWGLELPDNFDRPYQAANPREFWQRWHISLSTWLRDYLYISLGGNRYGTARTYLNLFLTMLLGGLWHGAAWTFVLWGAFHGAWLVVHRLVTASGRPPRTPLIVRRIVTFHLVCFAWVLFRAPNMKDAMLLLGGLGWLRAWWWSHEALWALIVVAIAAALHFGPAPEGWRRRFVALPPWVQGVCYAIGTALVFLQSPAGARFIYFQF